MRMLPLSAFDGLFQPMLGLRLGYVRGEFGNVGDTLQELALFRFVEHYGLDVAWLGPVAAGREPWDWELIDGRWDGRTPAGLDGLLMFGGGNMGISGGSARIRAKAARSGLPMILLPNSWRAEERLPGAVRYCAREQESIRRFIPEAELWPDLALGFDFPEAPAAVEPCGVFMRSDREGQFPDARGNRGAPFEHVGKRDVLGYYKLAARFERIYTDALHFAICGLAAGREVTLLPGRYHKSWGMFESWLRGLGCRWCSYAEGIQC